MPKLTYFPLLIDRWVSGTRFLTLEQTGAYINLICYLYENPDEYIRDEGHIARILGIRLDRARRIWNGGTGEQVGLNSKFTRFKLGFYHSLTRDILRNGGKIRSLQPQHSPTDPDPDPEEEKKPPTGAKKKSVANGTRLAPDWAPQPTLIAWASEKFPQVNLKSELEQFHDYWAGVPGQRGRKLDWDATFRNRIRDVAGRQRRGNSQAKPNGGNGSWQQSIDDIAAKLGISAKPGESYEAFGARVRAAATRAH